MRKPLLFLVLSLVLFSYSAHAVDLHNGAAINKNCALCHGLYGQGASGKLSPRLAGFPKEYLEKALKDYRSGVRRNDMMMKTAALGEMSDKDIADISAYLALMDVSKDSSYNIETYSGDVKKGKDLYKSDCKTCHGSDGFGKPRKEAPPLAGQHHEYLFQSIAMFKSKLRDHDNDPEDETFDEYTDVDVTNILAYIATLDDVRFDKTAGYKFIPPAIKAKRNFVVVATKSEDSKESDKTAKPEEGKGTNQDSGLQITDITQTVAQMGLEEGVTKDDAIEAMLSKAVELNLKLVGQQNVSKELEARGVKTPYLAIFQFCDPMDARSMIMSNPVFASYMPCRISLVEDQKGKLWLMMLNLDMLVNNDLLDPKVIDTAIRVNSSMLEIMVAGSTGEF